MKNKELFKSILALKLETIDHLLRLLPGEVGTSAKQIQSGFISLVHEVTEAYLQKEEDEKKEKVLKEVVIE